MSTPTPTRGPSNPPSSYGAIENLIATYAELVDDGDVAGVGTLPVPLSLLRNAEVFAGAGIADAPDDEREWSLRRGRVPQLL